MFDSVSDSNKSQWNYVTFIFFFLAIYIRNFQVVLPFLYFYIAFFLGTLLIQRKMAKTHLYLVLAVTIFICIGLLVKQIVFKVHLSNSLFALFLFFSILPFVVFSSFIQYKKLFFSSFFNKFVTFFCVLGLVGFAYLLFSMEQSEARYLWGKLGEESGKRGMINHLLSFGFYEDFIVRYNGFILDPNRWCFCLIFFYILVSYNSGKQWAAIAKFVIAISILLTMSRAGISLWLVYILFSNFVYRHYARVVFIPLALIAIVMFLLIHYGMLDVVWDRLTYGVTDSSNTRSRGYIWHAYLTSITTDWKTLLFGQGIDMDPAKILVITPHNGFLYLGFQFGLIGFILYLMLFIYSIHTVINSHCRRLLSFNFGLFLLLCMTMTDDYLALPFFWLVACFLFSQRFLKHHSEHSDERLKV